MKQIVRQSVMSAAEIQFRKPTRKLRGFRCIRSPFIAAWEMTENAAENNGVLPDKHWLVNICSPQECPTGLEKYLMRLIRAGILM